MRIPLTKYGLPQVVAFPAMLIGAMVTIAVARNADIMTQTATFIIESILFVLLVWVLSFFRDPHRTPPSEANILLSPADGTVSDIETIEEDGPLGTKTLRISIFLSIFNVHINRTPCHVRIDKVTYKHGQFKNAMDPASSRQNESNDIRMTRLDAPKDTLLCRQISGAIARRIVCKAKPAEEFAGGQKFGMIKFGSRTELYLPARENAKPLVSVGDRVKAGLTILVRYE